MHIVNGNDMDTLFKEAADNYLLNTVGAADWDKINAALNEPVKDDAKKKRRFIFLWWLLLLPLGWLLHFGWQRIGDRDEAKKADVVTATSVDANKKQQKNFADTVVSNKQSNNEAQEINPKSKYHFSLQENSSDINTAEFAKPQKGNTPVQKNFSSKTFSEMLNESIQNNAAVTAKSNNYQPVISSYSKTEKAFTDSSKSFLLPDRNSIAANDKQVNTTAAASPVKIQPVHYNFYAGIMLGADLSTVRLQHTTSPGYSYGLLLGYKINRHWQIESGFYMDKKNYYTKGEYFDKSSTPYLQNVNLLKVEGNCNMIELPLNIRYNFSTGKANTWFASAGVSTYLMNKEYYDFHFTYNGNYGERGYDYHNSPGNWFSVINLGAGYEHNLGNAGRLRLEPYMRFSAAGVGRGKLLLNSAGVYAGYTIQLPRVHLTK